jgi:hypothetical protein
LNSDLNLIKLLEFERYLKTIYKSCFKQQRAVINCNSKRKVIRCSRRAGKTELAAVKLIHSSLSAPSGISLYIALTRKSAKRLLWGRLKALLAERNVKYQASESDLILAFDNGSEIWLAGANQGDVAETLRGHAYRLVILDECASFRGHIDMLIEEILEPATVDENGELWIMGTPSWDFSSYFYKANHSEKEWQSFHWTLFDNPHMPHAEQWVHDLKRRRGWSDDNPILLREYYGLWIKTMEEMVYLFNPLRNVYSNLPKNLSHFVLGVDIGFEDKMAFSIVAHEENNPVAYVVHCEKHHQMLIHDLAMRIKKIQHEFSITATVLDEGGLGKAIAEELRQRYMIPCKAAEKRNKRAYIELFNSELKEGRILVADDNPIIKEWNTLLWDESKKLEKPGQPNDLCDATLYAWRESFYYQEETVTAKPKLGSQEYLDAMEKSIIREKENSLKTKETTWW